MNQTLLKEQNEAIEKSRQVFKNYYKSKIDNLLKNYCNYSISHVYKKFSGIVKKYLFLSFILRLSANIILK